MSDKVRKTPGKMQLFLLKSNDNSETDEVVSSTGPGNISDADLRILVDEQGEGSYKVITGRIRNVSLASRTVTEFKIGG
jgi:hypothetical protein